MRIKVKGYYAPKCAHEEPMPCKARCLLLYLFSISRPGGECRPGYEGMKQAIRDKPGEKGCDATIRRYLKRLKKEGWIFHMRRTQGRMMIYLQIPFRFRVKTEVVESISVLSQ